MQGRASRDNPANRFERLSVERDPDAPEGESSAPATAFLKDASRSVIAYNDSPDLPFSASLNPYRGCEHGCIYCYARPTHEYLGLSAGLDFESRILVKEEAPALLERELSSRSWKPQVLALSGVTDPYQPVERRLLLTRRCLEVLASCRNPVSVITKNRLVARDADLLRSLARFSAAAVTLSVTTLDGELARLMEPRASTPARRLEAVRELAEAGVPVGVNIAPVIPGLNDHELPAVAAAAKDAGAAWASWQAVRLPHGVGALFEDWLSRHFPDRREKVLSQTRALRGGELNDPRFGKRFTGEGAWSRQFSALFKLACRKAGLESRGPRLSAESFRRPSGAQLDLFGGQHT